MFVLLQEERDCYIGQIFGMMSVLRSQCKDDKISVSINNTRARSFCLNNITMSTWRMRHNQTQHSVEN